MSREAKSTNEFWKAIPQEVLLQILLYLNIKDILSFASTCKRYYALCKDDFLWRKLFCRDFKVHKHIELKSGATSWNSEYKRLYANMPIVLTEVLEQHCNQVLHVSFSHNGEMFATCSKDANVIIWNSSYPCSVKNAHKMKIYKWQYTQYSEFNSTDTLLLVSGVLFNPSDGTIGEIAVFTINENSSSLHCRVTNSPYDTFGTWFSDQYLLSGDLHWLAHLAHKSVIYLNKAEQDSNSDNRIITTEMYKFYSRNANSIRGITVAHCPWLNDTNDPLKISENIRAQETYVTRDVENNSDPHNFKITENLGKELFCKDFRNVQNIEKRQVDNMKNLPEKFEKLKMQLLDTKEYDYMPKYLEVSIPKYLIFFTGSKTYVPHEIAIKRIRKIDLSNNLDSSLNSVYIERRRIEQENNEIRMPPNWENYNYVADSFDKIDKVIDLHGHIIGMALSPDNRFLYVNTRSWPENYVITNPLEPPPIAQEIDIHIIDLTTLKPMEYVLRAHKAYTPNTECFFIFLNVSDNYVASGAEDKHAYVWDRFYGNCLAKYKHQDVVNSVAFNPRDPEMLVTTSDDYLIKIWRSRDKVKKLNIPFNEQATEFRKSW